MDIEQLMQENVKLSEELAEAHANIYDIQQKLIMLYKDYVFDIIVSYKMSGHIDYHNLNEHLPVELHFDILRAILAQLAQEGKLVWQNNAYVVKTPEIDIKQNKLTELMYVLKNLEREKELL